MTDTFEVKTRNGDDADTLRTSEGNWQPGDTLIGHEAEVRSRPTQPGTDSGGG